MAVSNQIKKSGKLIRDFREKKSDYFASQVENVIERGVTDRVTSFRILPSSQISWRVTDPMPDLSESAIRVGLYVNPLRVKSVIDVGPSADNTEESDKFKDFWGAKAELRRFKDGRIVHAVGNLTIINHMSNVSKNTSVSPSLPFKKKMTLF